MSSFQRLLLLPHFIFICCNFIVGQSNAHVDHIGSEDGLTSQLIQHLAEDNNGNLWISTFVDVQKYDGYSVHVFPNKQTDLKFQSIIDLIPDQNGNMWVLRGNKNEFNESYSYNITIIDQQNNLQISFEDYVNNNDLSQEEIKKIQVIDDELFLITKKNRIYNYADSLSLFSTFKDTSAFIFINDNFEIITKDENRIEIFNDSGNKINSIDSTAISEFSSFSISSKGELYFAKSNKKYTSIFEYKNDNWNKLVKISEEEFSKYPTTGLYIEKYLDEYILVNGNFYSLHDTLYNSINNSIDNRPIYEFLVSKTNLLYIATNVGIYVYDNKKKVFKTIASSSSRQNTVRAIFVNKHIKAFKKDYQTETIINESENYNITFLKDFDLGSINYMHYQDPLDENVLWSCGLIKERLRKIDFKNQKIINDFEVSRKIYHSIHRSSISNKIYLTGEDNFYFLDETNKSVQEVNLNCINSNSIQTNFIIERDSTLWIGSSQGIISYNEKTKDCFVKPILSDSLQQAIQFIHIDNDNPEIVWLGSRRAGLIKWDTNSNSYNVYNTENGLSNNNIHAIIEDSNGRLWISTNRYLNCLDKKSNEISIFTEQDGISHQEFNKYSYYLDTLSNTIFFGGLNGYTYFNPDSISTNEKSNQIQLNLIGANKTKNDSSIESILNELDSSSTINIFDTDVSLQLIFSTNHLSNTDKINYSYRIKGLYDEWNTQNSNQINLNRLPYGTYTMEIISDLNKPAFKSEIFKLNISTVKPFRKTWKAYLLALIASIFVIWVAFKRYLLGIKKKNLNLEKLIDERTKELLESNRTKNKLFSILGHDLRTPISSLTDITEKIKFLAKNNRLGELEILAEQTKGRISALDNNLNNILMWAMSENDLVSEKPQKLSLLHEIEKVVNLYSHEINIKELDISINLINIDQVYVGLNVLQTILRNYINNAIKFSYQKGKIKFSKSREDSNHLELRIDDSGIGLEENPKSMLQQNIKAKGQGLGLGLKITNELSVKSGISIRLEKNKTGGTTVFINMPKQ